MLCQSKNPEKVIAVMALTGFRKGHSAQHSLLIMIEKRKRALDENIKDGSFKGFRYLKSQTSFD